MNPIEMYRQAKIMSNSMYEQIKNDETGEAPVKALVMVFVIAILAGALLPTGINSLRAGSNTTGTWTVAETATYGTIAILLIIAVILLIIRMATE